MPITEIVKFSKENEIGSIIVGGYDWTEFHAWFYDGRIWCYELSGCSYNSWEDSFCQNDPEPVDSVHSLFRKASKFVENKEWYGTDIADYLRFVSEVSAWENKRKYG